MGGFEGHLYPGLSFFFYGLHHAQLFSRALICISPAQHQPCGTQGRGPWARLWQVCDVGLVKILSACILVAQELHSLPRPFALLTKRYHQRDFLFRKQWQHITLYAAFLLSGCVDVASQHLLACRCMVLEQGAQALSMAMLLPLMLSHMQDTEGVELRSHLLLTQVMFLLTLVLTAELWVPSELRLQALKAFLCTLSGSWLMQLAFMLYRPMSGYKWMDDDHNDLAFVATAFCLHVTCVAILMLWIHGCCWVWYGYVSAMARAGQVQPQGAHGNTCSSSQLLP